MSTTADAASPPYSLRSERLLVRCWQPSDAVALKAAVDDSLEHLREWMPWALSEPTTIEAKVELLRSFRGRFDLGQDFVFGVFTADESRVVGGCGLHRRGGPRSLEIGYWVRQSETRQGYATELVQMLTRTAFATCGIERLDIKVEVGNAASAGVPRKLGFLEEATLRRNLPPADEADQMRDALLFTMTDDEFRASPLAAFNVQAEDCGGSPVSLDT